MTAETAPQLGDEAVSFREIAPLPPDAGGGDSNEHEIMVRKGHTIATFAGFDIEGITTFPAELATGQADPLRAACLDDRSRTYRLRAAAFIARGGVGR
ncbi:hypothetical protein [Streptomyces sp. NPDC056491]|uniref:hypothetical protein n=1 Tax=Streptomyces sp. NPDC056491 TaxID=3345837 RepID=UPI0036BFFB34